MQKTVSTCTNNQQTDLRFSFFPDTCPAICVYDDIFGKTSLKYLFYFLTFFSTNYPKYSAGYKINSGHVEAEILLLKPKIDQIFTNQYFAGKCWHSSIWMLYWLNIAADQIHNPSWPQQSQMTPAPTGIVWETSQSSQCQHYPQAT